MNITDCVQTLNVLNVDYDDSNITNNRTELILKSDKNENNNNNAYIISDADQELLILIEFKQHIQLNSIKIWSNTKNVDVDDNQVSEIKDINIYNLKNLNIDFNDLYSYKSDKSIICSLKKLQKNGQIINLQNDSKNSIKFKNTKYLAIHIKSNQNDTEKTILNAIKLNGKYHEKQ